MLNSITIHGRLCCEPELKTTQSGVSFCSFTVAVDRSYAKQGEEKQTDFFTVEIWRGPAEALSKYFSKGSEIVVFGSMESDKWQDKNGNNRISWKLKANGFDFCGSKSSGNSDSRSHESADAKPPNNIPNEDFTPILDDDIPF